MKSMPFLIFAIFALILGACSGALNLLVLPGSQLSDIEVYQPEG